MEQSDRGRGLTDSFPDLKAEEQCGASKMEVPADDRVMGTAHANGLWPEANDT